MKSVTNSRLQVADHHLGGAGGAGARGHLVEVFLLADVGDEGDDLPAAFDQDLEDAGGVEAAGVGEYESFFHGLGGAAKVRRGATERIQPAAAQR